MYELFLSLIEKAVKHYPQPGKLVVDLVPVAAASDIDGLLAVYPDAPTDFLAFIRSFANGGHIELKNEEIFMDIHSAERFVRLNQVRRKHLSIARYFYDVASYGGCGDSLVIDGREGPLRGDDATFDIEPLAASFPAFLERVARELLAGRDMFYWY